MEVWCCGGFHSLRFSGSGTRTRNHCFPIRTGSSSSDLRSFRITPGTSGHASSVGYDVLLPVTPILSTKVRCMPGPVSEISLARDGHVPIHHESLDPSGPKRTKSSIRRERIIARVNKKLSEGVLPPYFLYLMDLGLKLEQIKKMTRRFPELANCSVERKFKPLVEFLLNFGICRSVIPRILNRCPQLCGVSIEKNLLPTMAYLESVGVDKSRFAWIISCDPRLLIRSRQKLKAFVVYFSQIGFSMESIANLFMGAPQLCNLSIEDNIAPTVACLESLGVDKSCMEKVICRCPQILWLSRKRVMGIINHFSQMGLQDESIGKLLMKTPKLFGLSVDKNIKRTTDFLLDQGFTNEDVVTMVSNAGSLYCCSLEKTVMPKWEFFLQTCYPKSVLVKFPQYFGYSLEGRIKPRYNLVMKYGVPLTLNYMLAPSEEEFRRILQSKLKDGHSCYPGPLYISE